MLKSTFIRLQRCRRQLHGSVFIRLAVVASQMYEIKQNSAKIWTYSSSRLSKVINFDASRKRICNFLLVINSNYERNLYRFRDIDAFRSKIVVVVVVVY